MDITIRRLSYTMGLVDIGANRILGAAAGVVVSAIFFANKGKQR
jgi:hypothetical protein